MQPLRVLLLWYPPCTALMTFKNSNLQDKDCVLGAFASTFKYNSKVRTVISTTMHGAARSVGGLAKELKTLQSDNTKLKAGLSAVKATRYKVCGCGLGNLLWSSGCWCWACTAACFWLCSWCQCLSSQQQVELGPR
jgi:hypothetical protein